MNLREEIKTTLNRCCAENQSNTPDWILADYLITCLDAFDRASRAREKWYGYRHSPGQDGPAKISER